MHYDVIIVGGGPAGTSAAIGLARAGLRVLLLEAKQMPREKLCGEFITPESFPTLERLGVMNEVLAAGAQRITRLSLTASSGRQVSATIADMSRQAEFALGLSRARLDQILFDRARAVGAICKEGFAVKQCLFQADAPCGVEATSLADGVTHKFDGGLIIDASGRNSRLTLGRSERVGGRPGSRLYAFKAHLAGAEAIQDQVELYFFRRGYGGLSRVENGLANLCFIADEASVRESGGDVREILNRTIMENPLARKRLADSETVGKWLSTGPLTFGRRRLSRDRVIAIGDASGMIDPFTGTGIQVALRTGELAAQALAVTLGAEVAVAGVDSHSSLDVDPAAAAHSRQARPINTNRLSVVEGALALYRGYYDREFGRRMTASSLLRVAAFSPAAANALGALLAGAPRLTRYVLRATRSQK